MPSDENSNLCMPRGSPCKQEYTLVRPLEGLLVPVQPGFHEVKAEATDAATSDVPTNRCDMIVYDTVLCYTVL
jgi:hypothetical protein